MYIALSVRHVECTSRLITSHQMYVTLHVHYIKSTSHKMQVTFLYISVVLFYGLEGEED